MKSSLLILLFLPILAFSQKRNKIDYAELSMHTRDLEAKLEIDSTSDGGFELFSIARSADENMPVEKVYEAMRFAVYKNYNSGDRVIQYESKDEGKLLCRSVTDHTVYHNVGSKVDGGYFTFDITILCKTGRARIAISNIIHNRGAMTQMRDGSNYGDRFPSTWKVWGDGALGQKVNNQSQVEWNKIKLQVRPQLIATIQVFKDALSQAAKADF